MDIKLMIVNLKYLDSGWLITSKIM